MTPVLAAIDHRGDARARRCAHGGERGHELEGVARREHSRARVVLAPAAARAPSQTGWGHRSTVTVIVIVACSVVGLSAAAVMVSAGSRGRPRWAIPPDLRDHDEHRLLHRQ